MSTLIVYASKYGATEKIAEIIASELADKATLWDIDRGSLDISGYDGVIVGGSIYMNKIQKKIKSFVKRNESKLLNKKLGLFIGCYTPAGTEGYIEQFFPSSLLKHAKSVGMLGGLMQYDKMNFIYRKLFQSLKKIDGFNQGFKEPKIEEGLINKFVSDYSK